MTSRSSAIERHLQTEREGALLMDSVERYGTLKPKNKTWDIVRCSFFGLQALVGIFEVILASIWSHWPGALVGVFVTLFAFLGIYVSLGTIYYSTRTKYLKHLAFIIDVIVLMFCLFLIGVHLVSLPNPYFTELPLSCHKTTNCCRLTNVTSANVQASGMTVPILTSDISDSHDRVRDWLQESSPYTMILFSDVARQAGTTLERGLSSGGESMAFFHARFLSTAWGFADDFYVALSAYGRNNTMIQVQSESRLGVGDFGVNRARVETFLSAITASPD